VGCSSVCDLGGRARRWRVPPCRPPRNAKAGTARSTHANYRPAHSRGAAQRRWQSRRRPLANCRRKKRRSPRRRSWRHPLHSPLRQWCENSIV
jgi:hypothetical protein